MTTENKNPQQQQHQVQVLRIDFDLPIQRHDLPSFRGMIAEMKGLEAVHFHNHDNQPDSSTGYRIGYSLVQYRDHHGKAALLLLQEACKEADEFVPGAVFEMPYRGVRTEFSVTSRNHELLTLKINENRYRYRINDWLALNDKNYSRFKVLPTFRERIAFLEKIMISQMLSFGQGVGWFLPPIEVSITDLREVRPRQLKQVRSFLAFSVNFETNVQLIPDMGLGKSVSRGFGRVFDIR